MRGPNAPVLRLERTPVRAVPWGGLRGFGGAREVVVERLPEQFALRIGNGGGGVAPERDKHRQRGRFRTARAQRAHSARTAPIITVIIQVTTLKTTHLRNHAQSIQNSKIQTSDACHGSQGPKFCPL